MSDMEKRIIFMTGTGLSRAGIGHIALAIKRFREDAPYKAPDCAEEEKGDAEASATDDDKAADALNKQISEMFSCRSNQRR